MKALLLGGLRIIFTAAVAVALFAFAWLFRFNDPNGSYAYLTDDHFFYLVRGWQILFSELPVRDFVDHGAPLYYYVAAAVQIVFGRGTLSELGFSVAVLAACAVAIFLLAARASGSRLLGAAAAFFHILLQTRFYNYPKILVYVIAIPVIWSFANRPSYWRAALIAAVAVVAFLFRHDHAVFIAGAAMVTFAMVPGLSLLERGRYALACGALFLLLVSPYLAFIQVNGGLVTYFQNAAAWAERDRARETWIWPGVFENPDGRSDAATTGPVLTQAVSAIQDNWVAWMFYGEMVLPLAALLLLAVSPSAFRPGWRQARVKLATVTALAVMLNLGFLRSPLEARLADPSVPHAILIAWICVALGAIFLRRDLIEPAVLHRWRLWGVRFTVVALAVPVLVLLWVAATNELPDLIGNAYMNEGPARAVERSRDVWDGAAAAFPIGVPDSPTSLTGLAYYVRECTEPADRIFTQEYFPQIAALAERGFAGGHADLRPGFFTSERMQRLTVERLTRQSVPMLLVGSGRNMDGFRDSFPLISRYIDEHYDSAGERQFDGRSTIQLLVRRDRTPVGVFPVLDWPCYRASQ